MGLQRSERHLKDTNVDRMEFGGQMSPEDIHWEGEEPGTERQIGRGGPGQGAKKGSGRGSAGVGRGRGFPKGQAKDLPPSQNGIGKKGPDDIEILDTGCLIKEVQSFLSLSLSP